MPSAYASIQRFRIPAVDPEVSVVMPCLNEANTHATCIRKQTRRWTGRRFTERSSSLRTTAWTVPERSRP